MSSVSQSESLEVIRRSEELKYYSWCEIIKHDKPDDCWIVIQGKVYDVTKLLDIHPGGRMILDGAGGECTFMWHSYHPIGMVESGVPQKYLIGQVRDYEDFYSYDGTFYSSLKRKVEAKVPRGKRRHDIKLYIKITIIYCPLEEYLIVFV